jgi:4-carboxymuconolactone decarboxylase
MSDGKPRSEKFERGLKARRAVTPCRAFAGVCGRLQLAEAEAGDRVLLGCNLEPTRPRSRSRSLLNLGMISAPNRLHELKIHIRGALNNGITKAHLPEVFLQIAVYCGVPARLDSFRIAKDVFEEVGIRD